MLFPLDQMESSDSTSGMEALCRNAGSMLFNVSVVPAVEARKAEGAG